VGVEGVEDVDGKTEGLIGAGRAGGEGEEGVGGKIGGLRETEIGGWVPGKLTTCTLSLTPMCGSSWSSSSFSFSTGLMGFVNV